MCLAKLTGSSRESHVNGFVTRIVLVSILVNLSSRITLTRRLNLPWYISRESHVNGFVTRIVLVSILVNLSSRTTLTRRHNLPWYISFIISCMRFCVICSFCLIADYNVGCLITDRLFEMEATLIKILHCLFFGLHVIRFNTFIHWFQSLAVNRFNIKHHEGSRAGAVVRAITSHRCGPGSILSSVHMWLSLLLVLSLFREVFPRVLRFSLLFKN